MSPRRELASDIYTLIALNVQAITTNTTTAGNILDLADYDLGCTFLIFSDTITDGTYTPLVEEGDDPALSDAAAVADTYLYRKGVATGQEANAAFVAADDNKLKKLSYIGNKRYVRISLVSTGVSTGGTLGVIALKGPEIKDVGDPA